MRLAVSTSKPRFRIIHETNPTKYYPAVVDLAKCGEIELSGLHRASVGKEWLRSWISERKGFVERTRKSLADFRFRVSSGGIRGETIMIALAPWDYRLFYYIPLVRHNLVIYHTSWPDWRDGMVPRNYGPLEHWLVPAWRKFLRHPNVRAVAVTEPAAEALRARMGLERIKVIPHCAEEVFYEAAKEKLVVEAEPLRLLYVGEISQKKGLPQLLDLFATLPMNRFTLSIVGDGPLRDDVAAATRSLEGAEFLGPVAGRQRMAELMSQHDVLVVPSQRTKGWEELFGMVIVEAMAAGLVVVASNHVGPHGILSADLPETLFDETDLAGMAAFLRRLADDSDYRSDVSRRSRAVALTYRLHHVRDAWRELILGTDS